MLISFFTDLQNDRLYHFSDSINNHKRQTFDDYDLKTMIPKLPFDTEFTPLKIPYILKKNLNCNMIYEISKKISLKMSLQIWKYKNKLTKSISLHQNKIISVTWQIKATTFPYKPFDFLVLDFYFFFLQRKIVKLDFLVWLDGSTKLFPKYSEKGQNEPEMSNFSSGPAIFFYY